MVHEFYGRIVKVYAEGSVVADLFRADGDPSDIESHIVRAEEIEGTPLEDEECYIYVKVVSKSPSKPNDVSARILSPDEFSKELEIPSDAEFEADLNKFMEEFDFEALEDD